MPKIIFFVGEKQECLDKEPSHKIQLGSLPLQRINSEDAISHRVFCASYPQHQQRKQSNAADADFARCADSSADLHSCRIRCGWGRSWFSSVSVWESRRRWIDSLTVSFPRKLSRCHRSSSRHKSTLLTSQQSRAKRKAAEEEQGNEWWRDFVEKLKWQGPISPKHEEKVQWVYWLVDTQV